MKTLALVVMLFFVTGPVLADDEWSVSGDIRAGYLNAETRARSGVESDAESVRFRLRVALRGEFTPEWQVGARLAGVFDTDQPRTEAWFRGWAPSPGGLAPGQFGLDELYLHWRPDGSAWQLRVGRMQVAFPLQDMMKKSLDYNDSPNFDVTWTDGVWWQHRMRDWTAHVVLHHNPRQGPTRTLRPPLDFTDSDARVGTHFTMVANERSGVLTQRALTVSWMPSALRPLGLGSPEKSDHLAVVAKTVAEWGLGNTGSRFALGSEVGYAFHTPTDANGLAWQVSLNVFDFVPAHDIALVYGRVGAGWLISSDFRQNESLVELRWAWRVTPAWAVDARVRRRDEMKLPATALMSRRTDDFYLRTTLRF